MTEKFTFIDVEGNHIGDQGMACSLLEWVDLQGRLSTMNPSPPARRCGPQTVTNHLYCLIVLTDVKYIQRTKKRW